MNWDIVGATFFGYSLAIMASWCLRTLGEFSYSWWRNRMTHRAFERNRREWINCWKHGSGIRETEHFHRPGMSAARSAEKLGYDAEFSKEKVTSSDDPKGAA